MTSGSTPTASKSAIDPILRIAGAQIPAKFVHRATVLDPGDYSSWVRNSAKTVEMRIDAIDATGQHRKGLAVDFPDLGFALGLDESWFGRLRRLHFYDVLWHARSEAWLTTDDAVASMLLQWGLLSPNIGTPLMARRFRKLMDARDERWSQLFLMSYSDD